MSMTKMSLTWNRLWSADIAICHELLAFTAENAERGRNVLVLNCHESVTSISKFNLSFLFSCDRLRNNALPLFDAFIKKKSKYSIINCYLIAILERSKISETVEETALWYLPNRSSSMAVYVICVAIREARSISRSNRISWSMTNLWADGARPRRSVLHCCPTKRLCSPSRWRIKMHTN